LSHSSHARDALTHTLHHLAHLLPAQGPIGVFIHHNTLHAFQHLPFEKAVLEASALFGTEPYLPEAAYRAALAEDRIRNSDIDAVLAREIDAAILPGLSRRHLWRVMLQPGIRSFDSASMEWRMEEGDLASDFASIENRALFKACAVRTDSAEAPKPKPARPVDEIIHPLLIRLCSVYLDQGMSYWPMPGREEGFYPAVRKMLAQPGALFPPGLSGLDAAFRSQLSRNMDSVDVLLDFLDPDENQWEQTLRDELLALPGWPGLFSQLENDPALFPHVAVPCSLSDFLAVRMTLAKEAARNLETAPEEPAVNSEAARLARAASIYDAARLAGLDAATVANWSPAQWTRFVVEIESFDNSERRRVYHLAYEHWHEQNILLGLSSHRREVILATPRIRPAAQVFFCIDEREESMRRALEEVDPAVETFGAAGFFGVAVDYKGIDDAHGFALCPVVVKPQHAVFEQATSEDSHLQEKRESRRRLWARLVHGASVSSRSLVRGALSTAVLGTLTSVPLITRVLAPRQYGKLRDALNRAFLPKPRTELLLMRDETRFQQTVEGLLLGFSHLEKADRVASVLGPVGLTGNFARLVVILGHGSTSLNNPHESAYDCGACGGRRGGPNARLFATMANRPAIRRELATRGIRIPHDTWFVGGDHDTCSDAVELFDLDAVPPSHKDAVATLRASFDQARAHNARERARRFESCPTGVSPLEALHHVEERSEHLAQPRQECGHATNAVCVVGRRQITRNLFLDRRAFLVSYDPAVDTNAQNLTRILGAVVPVCAGINLEYYFSRVDNQQYGCGTKLPHNVTSLMGVMDGHASDLRTGLPLQMVEIHEPVRILFVIETTPEVLEGVLETSPGVREFVVNRWIRVATMHPETGRIQIRRDSGYEDLEGEATPLPVVSTSYEWFKGKLDHLPMAAIRPAAGARLAG
jgi:uncharacterized protein YbcC (UPF0753/DUF2309 family)